VRILGSHFRSVKERCINGRYQPSLLFYERFDYRQPYLPSCISPLGHSDPEPVPMPTFPAVSEDFDSKALKYAAMDIENSTSTAPQTSDTNADEQLAKQIAMQAGCQFLQKQA